MIKLSETKPKARKDYMCDGYDQIERFVGKETLKEISDGKYDLQDHNLKKGEVHICQTWVDCGSMYSWRTCQTCLDAIDEHEIYLD